MIPVIVAVALLPWFLHPASSQISVVDDLGRTVALRAPAQRIISLAPSVTECLFALGAGDQVVGVTDYCTYPPATATKRRVGGMINPSIETIVGMMPDLIVVSMEGNMREDFKRLTSLAIPVFVTNPRTLADIRRSLEQLGRLTGQDANAALLNDTLLARENAVRARAGSVHPRVLFFVSLQPLMAVGRNTFLNELLRIAGAENLAARTSGTYPAYSREAVLQDNPDIIFLTADIMPDSTELLRLFPEWRTLAAVRAGGVTAVDPDLVTRPGPRAVNGLELLFHLLSARRP
jgi:iron complex transport system substrate-binding protein